MNFSDADKVLSVIDQLKQAEILRAPNRALINDLFNGVPPYTRQEEEENNILVNVNWKMGTNLLHQCRRQYETAFLKPGNFFRVTLEHGPKDKRDAWSRFITRKVNKPLKRSLAFMEAYRSKFAGVVLHGVGPMAFEDAYKWIPYTFGIEDLLIPTDTYTTLENLTYFAIRKPYKPGALFRKTLARGKGNAPGWDLKAVRKLLDSYKDLNQNPHQWNFSEQPEKMSELYKQNLSYYDGDSAPTIWCWDFYYQEEEGEGGFGKWNRRLMLDNDYVPSGATDISNPIQFLYQMDGFADDLNNILHLQLGDGNNKPPFMYHSIRSVGWLLFDTVHMMNRLQCQFTEHVFEQMMMLLSVTDPNDRSRVEKFLLQNKGIMPEGCAIIPAAQRYQIDANLVNMLMSEYKQGMSESTAAYTQDIDNGTHKERTATEVMAQVNSVNSLTASLVNYAYLRETFAYREICRRFCLKDSPEREVKDFRAACLEEGIPESLLDVSLWEVDPERVLGGGNKVLEVAQAKELQAIRPQLDPDSQRMADRILIGAVTDNEQLASELVPDNPQNRVSDATHDADLVFGTLMRGVMIRPKGGFNQRDQIEELLRLMVETIKQIMASGGVGTPADVKGLSTVAQYTDGHIKLLAQDKHEKERAKKYEQVLGKIMNQVKAFVQRQQQAAQAAAAQNGQNPEARAKLQSQMLMDRHKLQSKEAATRQKLQHKQIEFQQGEQRKNLETAGELQRQHALTAAELHNKAMHGVVDAHQRLAAFEPEGNDDEG